MDADCVFQRNHVELDIHILDEEGKPLPLEGMAITWVARREVSPNPAAGPVVITKTVGNGIEIIGDGKIRVTLTADDLDLDPGGIWYEVRIVDVEGHPYTALQRRLVVRPTIVEEDD